MLTISTCIGVVFDLVCKNGSVIQLLQISPCLWLERSLNADGALVAQFPDGLFGA